MNAGGVIHLDLAAKQFASKDEIVSRIAQIGESVRGILDDAEVRGITPLQPARERAEVRLRGAVLA